MKDVRRHASGIIGLALALVLSGCGSPSNAASTPTGSAASPSAAATATSAPAAAASTAPTYKVEVWNPPFDFASPRTPVDYAPLAAADKPESLCVSIPHIKDSYWLAVNYGVVSEAERLGVNVEIVEAGGYANLKTQISQIEQCVANGAKAVVIGAISLDGLNDTVASLRKQNIPVVAFMNDISSKEITAKSLSVPGEGGLEIAKHLVGLHPKGGAPAKLVWFPGPEKAGWSAAADKKFKETIAGGAIELLETKYGDTGKEEQAKLIEAALAAHPDMEYIVGTGQTAVTAIDILKERGLQDKIKVMAYYISPEVYAGLKGGGIAAAAVAPPVTIAKIAIDQAVRIVEGKEYQAHVGPKSYVLDASNIGTFETESSIPPDGFKITLRVTQ
ncbi:MAG TPA: TMAO reductase system periplasmic protein TorT [Herpetosiphonaceae bacterium]